MLLSECQMIFPLKVLMLCQITFFAVLSQLPGKISLLNTYQIESKLTLFYCTVEKCS